MALTRKQQRRAGRIDPDRPLSAMERQPAVLHCDRCERGVAEHELWRSVTGVPLTVLCHSCLDAEGDA